MAASTAHADLLRKINSTDLKSEQCSLPGRVGWKSAEVAVGLDEVEERTVINESKQICMDIVGQVGKRHGQ